MSHNTEKTIKIFIASSVVEFKEERTILVAFEAELNRIYKDSDIRFEITVSELLSNSLSEIGKQAEYNIEICNSRFVYFLIGKAIGKYTREEFRVAKEHFQDSKQPLIFTFFRYDISNPIVDESVIRFVEEDLNAGQEHYYTPFDHIDTVKLNIMSEIARHPDIGGSIGFQDGYAQLNGENIVPLKNIPMYQNNEDLAALKQQYNTLNDEYASIAAQLSHSQGFNMISKAYEIGLQRSKLLEEIERREKMILDNYLSYVSKARYGSEINWREKKALDYYNNGDYASGDAILSDELWDKEISAADEIGEAVTQTVHEYISGKRTLILSLLSREINENSAKNIISEFQRLSDYSEKYHTDLDVLFDYAHFLHTQRHYKEALEIASRLSKYYELYTTYSDTKKYDLYVLLGMIYHNYKDHTKSIQSYDHAEQFISQSDPDAAMKRASLVSHKAWDYLEAKKYNESKLSFNAIVESIIPEGNEEKQLLAQSYNGLGRISNAENRFDDALHCYSEAAYLYCSISHYENDEQIMELLSAVYNNLGVLFKSKTTDYESAEKNYRKSLEIKTRFYGINPTRWASKYALALANLSDIYGKIEESVEYAEKSYNVRKGLYQVDPNAFGFGFGISCYRISSANLANGNQEKAIVYGKQSVEIIDSFFQRDSIARAEEMTISYRKYAESLSGVDDTLAEKEYREMLRIEKDNEWLEEKRKVTLFYNHLSYARFLNNLGKADKAKEQYEIALRHISELVASNDRLSEKKTQLIDEMDAAFKT